MKKGSPRRNLGNMLEASGLKKSLYVRLELNWAEALEKKPQYCSPSLFLLKRLADRSFSKVFSEPEPGEEGDDLV